VVVPLLAVVDNEELIGKVLLAVVDMDEPKLSIGGADGCLSNVGFWILLIMLVSPFILLPIGGASGGGNAFFASSLASINAHPRMFAPFEMSSLIVC